MQLNPMCYTNTAKNVKMLWEPASTARRHTSKTKEVTEKPTKKTKVGQKPTWHHTVTRDFKPLNLAIKISKIETLTIRRW